MSYFYLGVPREANPTIKYNEAINSDKNSKKIFMFHS